MVTVYIMLLLLLMSIIVFKKKQKQMCVVDGPVLLTSALDVESL